MISGLLTYTDTLSLNKEYSDYYYEQKGSKFKNLKVVFGEHRELLSKYKAIMIADDDIIITPESLPALLTTPKYFNKGQAHNILQARKPSPHWE